MEISTEKEKRRRKPKKQDETAEIVESIGRKLKALWIQQRYQKKRYF